MIDKSDERILRRILFYCNEVEASISRYGDNVKTFEDDSDFYRSVSMCIMQVGEISKHLSVAFREETKDTIPWREIRGLRNLFAHDYDAMNAFDIFETAKTTIPTMKQFCESYLEEHP
jgi:uncharacterized protein with HEPN domain